MSTPASTTTATGPSYPRGPASIEAAIRQASQETGVDFAYLMEKASVESSFRPELKAESSSATGLYQFINSTWLSAMKAHGAEHGLGQYADAIQKTSSGNFTVADPDLRRQILDLRKDPKISAELAAELTRDNKTYLESKVGGPIGSTELYLAHFLGAAGAGRFLSAMRDNPSRAARDVMPDAANSNAAVFYDRHSGQPKTLAEVYDRFARKFSDSTGEVVAGGAPRNSSGGSALGQMIAGVAAERSPVAALNGLPLSSATMLALAALQSPDEANDDDETPYGSKRLGAQPLRPGATAVNAASGLHLTRKAS